MVPTIQSFSPRLSSASDRDPSTRAALRRGFRVAAATTLILATFGLVGCGEPEPERLESSSADAVGSDLIEPASEPVADPAAEAPDDEIVLVFLGDSLTAGFGVAEDEAYPALIGEALRADRQPVRVVNAGVSGDTTAGGLRRLDWVLRQRPDLVVVVLGGNDGLRGLDLEASEQNLRSIVERARAAGARVLLGGMLIPPSYGEDYTSRFAAIYPRVAEELEVALVPFVLDGVGGVPELNLADGIHPNAAGQEVIAATMLEHLRPIVRELAAEPAAAG
ncbi:MAG: arylesterase [Acidobacteriota bacterium]